MSVEAGKDADVVLLDANPLLDARNLNKISAVVLKGRYISRDELAGMKKKDTRQIDSHFRTEPRRHANFLAIIVAAPS